jgi:tetratricopeptide (TPR) repeat protein
MNRQRRLRPGAVVAPQKSATLKNLLLSALLFAFTLLVYAQVWDFGFVVIDDPVYVPDNLPVLMGLTPASVKWAWTRLHDCNWIPLTWLSLMLDTELFAGRPGGYHLTNALLHATNTVLLFLTLTYATRSRGKSAVVAALFGLHPLHVESVAWVAERKDVLSIFFGMLSLLTYVRYATRGGVWRLGASLLFVLCSLLSKQTLVTMPFLLLLLDYWPLGRIGAARFKRSPLEQSAAQGRHVGSGAVPTCVGLTDRKRSWPRLLFEKLPYFIASAAFCAAALMAQSRGGAVSSFKTLPFSERCINVVMAYTSYLSKTIFPHDLAVYYPHTHQALNWIVLGKAAILLAICGAAILCIRRYPFVFVGWFWFLGTLVPMIGLVQIGSQQMADRYTYFPLIGLFLAVTWLVPEFVPAGLLRTRMLPAGVLAALGLLAAITFSQISYWQDSVSLIRHAVESTQDNAVIHQFLGSAYLSEGFVPEEATDASARSGSRGGSQQAQANAPNDAYLNAAQSEFNKALALDPENVRAYANLGLIDYKRHQYAEARQHYLRAIEIDPHYWPVQQNMAALCYMTGDYSGAIQHSEQVLRQDPDSPDSEMLIAMSLRGQGRLDAAIVQLRRVLELKPNDPVAERELRSALAQKSGAGPSPTP